LLFCTLLERIGKKSYNMKESQSRINRRDFMKGILYRSIGSAAALAGLFFLPGGKTHRNNVLFIMVDDLRPQLGCYGETQMVTPYIDRLAAQGMVFERSYCQQAICAPSRTSLLSGLRPGTTGIYDLKPALAIYYRPIPLYPNTLNKTDMRRSPWGTFFTI
jgi:hypothetical protein